IWRVGEGAVYYCRRPSRFSLLCRIEMNMTSHPRSLLTGLAAVLISVSAAFADSLPEPMVLSTGWQMQSSDAVTDSAEHISQTNFAPQGWYRATVPGTVLTTLVNNHVYPEPLYGENNRPDKIPESLCRTSYWYRAVFEVPKSFAGKKVWLNFDGINYSADVWVNGQSAGTIRGAFTRGIFDISSMVTAGQQAALAVLIHPPPHPGVSHEHTLPNGMGPNGGEDAIDGPTFLCSLGWDWIPAIRDRASGIWQKV